MCWQLDLESYSEPALVAGTRATHLAFVDLALQGDGSYPCHPGTGFYWKKCGYVGRGTAEDSWCL